MYSTKENAKSIALVILGSCILAFGTYNFNFQNEITEGGVLGLILLVKNIMNISPSITSLLVDLSLFAIGARFFGKRFMALSVLASLSFSASYKVFESIGFIIPDFKDNMIIASILAGIGVGIGVGLVIRGGGAAGGDDVIALLGNKFTKLKINHIYLLTDAVILIASIVYLEPKQIFFSIVAVTISGKLIDIIYNGQEEKDAKDDSVEDVKDGITINA